jgi:hypothetical protein
MNLKSKNYMQNAEFSTRQSWFKFVCVQAVELVRDFAAECKKGWFKIFHPTKKIQNQTLPLIYENTLNNEQCKFHRLKGWPFFYSDNEILDFLSHED